MNMRYNTVTILIMVHDSRMVSVFIVRNYALVIFIIVYNKYFNISEWPTILLPNLVRLLLEVKGCLFIIVK